MLKSIVIDGFKSLKKIELNFDDLTVMVGANAAGKSNAIEALMLLGWLAQGRQLADLPHALKGEELKLRGQVMDLFAGSNSAELEFSCSFDSGHHLQLNLVLMEGRLILMFEALSVPGQSIPLYEVLNIPPDGGHDLPVAYNNFAKGGNKPILTCTNQQALFTQLLSPARFADKHTRSQDEIPAACRKVRDALQSLFFLDPAPRRMRDYAFKTDRILDSVGSNLSSVIYNLATEDQETVLALVQDLPEQNIERITFLEGPRGEVMLQLKETFGAEQRAMDAALLSDGTLRVLAIGAALLSVPTGSLVVIEEMDNGVHPSRAAALLERIDRICRERGIRVLLTTHNPALLDGLPRSAIPHVTFCYRGASGRTSLVRLKDLPDYVSLLAQGSPGTLLAGGQIDHYAKHATTPDQARAQVEQMLAMLRESS